ncbi:MAG: tape measure protein [Spirochaetales bacterium]|nr:tape measure protein [Spirochaetales bacterium]
MAKGPTVKTTFNAVDKVSKTTRGITAGVKKLAAVAGAAFVTGRLAQGVKSFVTEASKIEDAVAGFTPLMGGVKKANELVDSLNKTAATTPFQFENISAAAKQLLPVMNQDINKTVDTFRMLGDTAGGNAQKLDSITRGYTKAMLKGKVDMESLNMIAEAGVPIYSELADSMGVSVAEMMKMSSAGKISSDDLTRAFEQMTTEGGVFYNGMEIASQTLTGKLSTLKDNINLTKAAIGKSLMPVLKPMVDRLIEAAGKVREWATANQALIGQKIEGTIEKIGNAVKLVVKLWDSGLLPALFAGIGAYVAITKAIAAYKAILVLAQAAQLALNGAMAINPIGLIIVGIAALIAIVVLLVKNWDKVKAAMVRAWDATVNAVMRAKDAVLGFAKSAWEWFSKLLDNPLIAAAGAIFAPWLTIPALIVKHWEPLKEFIAGIFEKITAVVNKAKSIGGRIGNFLGGGETTTPGSQLYGRNESVIQTMNRSSWEGQLSISGVPVGSSYTQKGSGAPAVTLNTGYGASGL